MIYRYCPKCGTRFLVIKEKSRTRFYVEYVFDLYGRPFKQCPGCGWYLDEQQMPVHPPDRSVDALLDIIERGLHADICDACYEDGCDPYECECVCHIQVPLRKKNAQKALEQMRKMFSIQETA